MVGHGQVLKGRSHPLKERGASWRGPREGQQARGRVGHPDRLSVGHTGPGGHLGTQTTVVG